MKRSVDKEQQQKSLNENEHACAEFMAYFRALERGGHELPPYRHSAAVRDFSLSAQEILRVAQEYPSEDVDGVYERHPIETSYDRLVPVALRRYPHLLIRQVAILCFNQMKHSLSPPEYWSLLGHIWTANTKDKNRYDRHHTVLYRDLFSSNVPEQGMVMTNDERAVFSSFPQTLTVYRGCGQANRYGLSWTLSKRVAEGFARDWNSPPWYILEGNCQSTDVVAFFNRGNEQETIIPRDIEIVSTAQLGKSFT